MLKIYDNMRIKVNFVGKKFALLNAKLNWLIIRIIS